MERAFASLPAIIAALGEPSPAALEAMVFAAWKRVAGEQLSERTVPLRFRANRLSIAVEDKTWQRHLESLAPEMLSRLRNKLDDDVVKFIEFRIDASVAFANKKTRPTDDLVSDAPPQLAAAAEQICDAHLREVFLKAAAAQLANRDAN